MGTSRRMARGAGRDPILGHLIRIFIQYLTLLWVQPQADNYSHDLRHETLEAIMSMGKMAVLVFGFLVLTLVIATLATIPPG